MKIFKKFSLEERSLIWKRDDPEGKLYRFNQEFIKFYLESEGEDNKELMDQKERQHILEVYKDALKYVPPKSTNMVRTLNRDTRTLSEKKTQQD